MKTLGTLFFGTSISKTLLKIIFSFYLVIAITVTCFHMVTEYIQTKNKIYNELQLLKNTLSPSLANALWAGDSTQIKAIIQGTVELPSVSGVVIRDEYRDIINQTGTVFQQKLPSIEINPNLEDGSSQGDLTWYRSPILFTFKGKSAVVGFVTLFSTSDIVFNQVKLSFLFLCVNAAIKTVALWIIFLWAGRIILEKPLTQFINAARYINLNNLKDCSLSIDTVGKNEFHTLEETFNIMISRLYLSGEALKEKTNALKESEERFEYAFKGANDGIWDYDLLTEKAYYSLGWKEMLGYRDHEIKETSNEWRKRVHPDDVSEVIKTQREFIVGQSPTYRMEYRIQHKKGHYIHILARAHAVKNSQGDVIRIVGTHVDITRAKKAEELLKHYNQTLEKEVEERTAKFELQNKALEDANQKLLEEKEKAEQATRFKSEFLVQMSHKIRTPMSVIIGFNTLLLETQLEKTQKNYLSKISDSAHSLMKIINETLDLSKIEGGKIILEKTVFNLEDILTSITAIVGIKARRKRLTFSIDKPKSIPSHFIGDPIHLKQVLVILGKNAVKFAKAGEISLSVNENSCATQVGYKTLQFTIQVSETRLHQDLFKILFGTPHQVVPSINGHFNGIELDLQVCKEILELMGGQIDIKNTSEKGVSFTFSVNLKVTSVPQTREKLDIEENIPKKEKMQGAPKRNHILVVEDNTLNQQVISEILKMSGNAVTIISDGSKALNTLNSGNYDLVLMDIQMPEMDGLSATKLIRQESQYKTLPIIAMTANAQIGEKEKCIEIGMNDYLTKPVEQQELFKKIRQWLPSLQEKRCRYSHRSTPVIPPLDMPQNLQAIDMSIVSRNMCNNAAFTQQFLSDFKEKYQNIYEVLLNKFQQNDISTLQRKLHSLKGLSGTIGALNLESCCLKLEEECQKNNLQNISESLHLLKLELQNVLIDIETIQTFILQFNGSSPSSTEAMIDLSKASDLIVKLTKSLQKGLGDSDKVLTELIRHLPSDHFRKEIQLLHHYIEEFEFEEAIPLLEKISLALKENQGLQV